MTANPKLPGEPLTPEQVEGIRQCLLDDGYLTIAKTLCDSHEALREALRRAEAERDAAVAAGWEVRCAQVVAERDAARAELREMDEKGDGRAAVCDRLRAEVAKLREALAWYADPETWEQVDLLGRCPLTHDRDDEGLLGMRAREAIGPHISDALGSIRAALTPTPGSSARGNDDD